MIKTPIFLCKMYNVLAKKFKQNIIKNSINKVIIIGVFYIPLLYGL